MREKNHKEISSSEASKADESRQVTNTDLVRNNAESECDLKKVSFTEIALKCFQKDMESAWIFQVVDAFFICETDIVAHDS